MAKLFDKMFVNVILVGFAFMFIFTAFQTCSMMQRIVITSMKTEYPGYDGDGYISLAVIYAVFAISNWVAPSIISLIGSKAAMFLGGITYCLFIANFFFAYTWLLYLASALMGFGASVIWTGQGNFLTVNSDSVTMSRNSGVFWALLQCSLLFGNAFIYSELQGKDEIDAPTRMTLFGVLLSVCVLGCILVLLLRGGGRGSSAVLEISTNSQSDSGPKESLMKAFQLLQMKEMLYLCVTFFYTGLELSFFSGVYGTSIGSTASLGNDAAKFVGISGIFIGFGEILGGAMFGLLGKKTNSNGRDPIVLLGYFVHCISFFLIFINLPPKSSVRKTFQPSIIPSNVYLAMFCAFGLGFGDACFNTQVYSILGFMYPDDSAPAFAIFKFFQSVAAAIAFFYSTSVELPFQLLVLVIFGTAGTLSFWSVEWKSFSVLNKEKGQSINT